jgi:hypothetical protein
MTAKYHPKNPKAIRVSFGRVDNGSVRTMRAIPANPQTEVMRTTESKKERPYGNH